MSCCNQEQSTRDFPAPMELPDSTFCCMARMAYTVAAKAVTRLTGEEPEPWVRLSDDKQLVWATVAKSVLKGTFNGNDRFALVFADVLVSLTAI